LTTAATPNQAAWANNGGIYVTTGASTNSYGPVNLKYTTGTWTLGSEVRYVYDGMRVIQERDSANVPTVSYTRGRDLGGSLEGAGGIAGLLARSHGYSGGSWGTHNYYHADGGGNITMLIDASQVTVASYRYDPYGNAISSSGGLAGANVYRFSSKEIHANSGMYYYGYRFYDPNLQRWPNRDPLAEQGFETLLGQEPFVEGDGPNLYHFVWNDPLNDYDTNGLLVRLPKPIGLGTRCGLYGLAFGVGYGVGTALDQCTPVGKIGPAIGNRICRPRRPRAEQELCPKETDKFDEETGRRKCTYWCRKSGAKITRYDTDCDKPNLQHIIIQ